MTALRCVAIDLGDYRQTAYTGSGDIDDQRRRAFQQLFSRRRHHRLAGVGSPQRSDGFSVTRGYRDELRQFLTLFARAAFVPDTGGATMLTTALADTVFDTVFPDLANASKQPANAVLDQQQKLLLLRHGEASE